MLQDLLAWACARGVGVGAAARSGRIQRLHSDLHLPEVHRIGAHPAGRSGEQVQVARQMDDGARMHACGGSQGGGAMCQVLPPIQFLQLWGLPLLLATATPMDHLRPQSFCSPQA